MKDFVVFRVLWNSNTFTPEATQLVCDYLFRFMVRTGKPVETAECCLALYKLKTEMK